MQRRSFLGTLVGALVTAPVVASAQPAGKVYRIGHLAASSPSAENTRLLGAFQAELRERGWVEGQNVAFEYRWAEGRYERLPALAAELTETKVDLIVAGGTPNAMAAREVTRIIPIVMVGATTPVELGLVNSLARPGGNVTGVTFDVSPEQTAKLLELLTEVPGVSRIAVLLSRGYPAADRYRRALEQAARTRQRSIRFVEVLKPEDFDAAFAALRRTPVDGLIVMTDQVTQIRGDDIVRFATEMKLATVFGGPARRFVAAGGLISWSANSLAYWRQAATYVDKILRGATPATLPVEQPTTFELVVNLRTAKALGLTLPPSLLLRADEVIE
ncbi:MAG TPA: ABC transporter substrate-binding protein [Methylomirabilota bacterium]|nr:ABC transporter substrate-binding protein [Methylomirabilota bacterium]